MIVPVLSALTLWLPQPAVNPAPQGAPSGEALTVYLLTFDPGELAWERFGHNALWIRDKTTGTDLAFDYGRFSFGRTTADKLRFLGQFAQGLLNYSMGDGPTETYLDRYARMGRSIWVQEFDLSPIQRVAIRDFLYWNRTEEHKYYQYNYYLDNCSTRIRDVLDRVVGGQIKQWADTLKTPWTYRDHTRRTTEASPVLYTLLNIGLGQPTDHRLSAWEEMFLPISLRPYLNSISITDSGGRVHRLVKEEKHLVESDRWQVAREPPNWTGRYFAIGGLVGGLLMWLGWLGSTGARWRLAFAMVGGLWSIAAGLSGLALTGLWGFTNHIFSYSNENLFQLNLASLAVAAAIPKGLFSAEPARWAVLMFVASLVAVSALLGLFLKMLPAFDQANLDLIALFLPIHLGLVAGLWRCRPAATGR